MWLLVGGAGLATGLAIGLTMHYQEVDAVRATELTVPPAFAEVLHEVMAKVGKPRRHRHVVAWVLLAVLALVIGVVVKALHDVPDIGRLTDDDNGQPKE